MDWYESTDIDWVGLTLVIIIIAVLTIVVPAVLILESCDQAEQEAEQRYHDTVALITLHFVEEERR